MSILYISDAVKSNMESSSSGASSLNRTHSSGNADNRTLLAALESSKPLNTVLTYLNSMLPECWSANPESRLTALRIRKNLQRIDDLLAMGEDPAVVPKRSFTSETQCHLPSQVSDSSTLKNVH